MWLTERGIDLGTIGLFSLVGLPYTFKFLWAPLTDALDVPFLSHALGRRRGWLVFTQIWLVAAIVLLGLCDPTQSLPLVIFGALLVATASATQDIVIDAFRIESLEPSEQGAGMAGYVAAYRIGMLVSGAGVLVLVTWLEAQALHATQYGCGAISRRQLAWCSVSWRRCWRPSLMCRRRWSTTITSRIRRLAETATGAFGEFLTRDAAIAVLLFVVLYKFCDAFAGALTAAFVINIGFDKATYAAVVKGVGLAAALIGGFAGGSMVRALPLSTSLWIGGFLQMASNLTFSWLAVVGVSVPALTATIIVENFTGAIGTVVFVAYLSALCRDRAHTATQYALLTALAAVGAHHACFRRRLYRRIFRLGDFLRDHRRVRDPELAAAVVAAGARTFRNLVCEAAIKKTRSHTVATIMKLRCAER